MSDILAFVRDNIDNNPDLISTIANNMDKPVYRALQDALSNYLQRYGYDFAQGKINKDTTEFHNIVEAVEAFRRIAIDNELEELVLPQAELGSTKLPKTPQNILPPSKEMSNKTYLEQFGKGFTTPSKRKLSSLYDDSDVDDSENANNNEDTNNRPLRGTLGQQYLGILKRKEYNSPENQDDDNPYFYKPKSNKSSKRADKTMKTVKEHLRDDYTYDNRQINSSEFRDSLWNILINGNYRVKFSPKCSTRTGASEYCKKKFDENGYPLYRLIPPNTRDDFENEICDLNGDKVDDIVIVDKSGRPVIINGYKLVKASPYKKIWQEERAQNRGNILPFNVWLQKTFDLAHTWDYQKEVWDKGTRDWNINNVQDENAKRAYQTYIDAGVGKPKLNKRITARGLWSSIFNRIWLIALETIFAQHAELKPLKPIFNYMKVSNAIFIKFYELPAMANHDCEGKWMKWISYKNLHPKEVNAEIGMQIQEEYNREIKAILPLDGSISSQEINPDSRLGELVTTTITVILAEGMNATDENMEQLKQFGTAIANNQVDKYVINNSKEEFKTNIDEYVDSIVGGNYMKYKQIREADKLKNIEKVGDYIKHKA